MKKQQVQAIEFINEEDRTKFTGIIIDLLKDAELKDRVLKMQQKYKGSFTVKVKSNELKELGIEPEYSLKFKKVRKTGEWDVDIHLNKMKSANVSEYFNTIRCK